MNAVLLMTGGAFALGAAVILPGGRAAAAMLWPFYRSEFLIVGAFLLPAAAGGWVFLLLLLLLAVRGQYELYTLTGARWRLPLLAAALLLALALTAVLRGQENGFLWLFLAQLVVEVNDSFALLLGKLIGKRKILPRLSPGKTLEGLIAGLLAGGGAGFVAAHWLIGLDPATALIATLTALIAGLAGDLALSALKRVHGVKDFRPVASLHGGVLDIYDSLLFAAPALLLLRWAL
jgi:phosphatidate cytidylyltransferase